MKRFAGIAFGLALVGFLLTGMGMVSAAPANAAGHWTQVDTATLDDLDYVRFFDADSGTVKQLWGCVLFTTSNSGVGWTATEPPLVGDAMEGVFLDAQHGWVCDNAYYVPEGSDGILRTSDGGKTWHRTEVALPRMDANLFFVDANVGYLVGAHTHGNGGGVLKTTDGGTSWGDPAGLDAEDSSFDEGLYDVFFVNALEGWTVGQYLYSSGEHGHAVYHTTDGGVTWKRQYGRTYEGNDASSTVPLVLSDVYFVDSEHGWVLGALVGAEKPTDGFLLRTENGGDSWQKVVLPVPGALIDSCFVDARTGWVVGEDGVILRTADGGVTWTTENSGTRADLHSVSFTDTVHGWAVGEWGTVLKYSTEPHAPPFSDTESSPYRQSIESLARAGIIGGYDDGTYRPQNTLLRAQFAKIIDGALGFTVTEDLTSRFVDLGPDDPTDLYPHEYVAMGCMKDIILGKTATTFEPFRPLLRAQAMSMAWRGVVKVMPGALDNPPDWFESTWDDFDIQHAGNVAGAEYNGLLSGLPLASLDPWGAMTREEAAQLLNNVRTFMASAMAVRGTASDAALVASIRAGWPDVGDVIFLPAELPQGWRFSGSGDPRLRPDGDYQNPAFWYVPMSGPPDVVCAYRVQYTNGQDAIELSVGYRPASGGSRYFHELAQSASPVDIFLEANQWRTFIYRDDQTDLSDYHVLFVDLNEADGGQGNISYVEVDYRSKNSRAVAEAIASAIVRAPFGAAAIAISSSAP